MKSCLDPVGFAGSLISTHPEKILPPTALPALELWGGVECTVNRVGDRYFNQCEWNGHQERLSDLDLFAEIGICAIRYPVIWEMLAPDSLDHINWTFPDERLARLRELGIRPIVDLVHHGSGPRYAPIDTPDFAVGVARFAGEVARRYPWLDAYTPINEPLTTARFSGQYGVWYPHGHDHATFVRMLINECQATVLAMRAIREVNPRAQLIQTDDLGYIYSAPALQGEAEFQNNRRWLGFDLLCGRVGPKHPLWRFLLDCGISADEICWFSDNPCPPDIIGINYYPTSDRFLDEGVDTEAVRALDTPLGGFKERLREAWDRYHLPLAVTEAHLGCTREEQMRWFYQAWKAADELRTGGVDVRAVTAWSLLGAYNWNSLVTRDEGYYEPGVFDLRSLPPRPTALAGLMRQLSQSGDYTHPVLELPGWWQRPMRLHAPLEEEPSFRLYRDGSNFGKHQRPLLILGGTGALGSAFARLCEMRGLPYYALSSQDVDLNDACEVEELFAEIKPWAVVNASGHGNIDQSECETARCFAIHTEVAAQVARCCARHGAVLLCFSSDQVFDGSQNSPYTEGVLAAPLNTYGRSKAAMEKRVREACPQALIARLGPCFGPWDQDNFLAHTLRLLSQDQMVVALEDVVVSPTYVPDMANIALDLLLDGESGVWHLTSADEISWAELARQGAQLQEFDPTLVLGCSQCDWGHPAKRPSYSVLGSERGILLPSLEQSLSCFHRDFSRELVLV